MKSICIIGAINMDITLKVGKMPQDGETTIALGSSKAFGGKGSNAAIATKRMDINTRYYGCVGDDAFGHELIDNLNKTGIDISNMSVKEGISTGTAYIILDSEGNNRIISAPGGNQSITRKDIRDNCYNLIKNSDIVLIQLEISREGVLEIIELCKELDKTLVLDAGPGKGWEPENFKGVDYVSPNETELSDITGLDTSSKENVIKAAAQLLKNGAKNVIVKLGKKGSLFINQDIVLEQPSYNVKTVDSTGAGDSYMSGFCKGLIEGLDISECMELGSKCGAIAVTREGASPSMPSLKDLEDFSKLLV